MDLKNLTDEELIQLISRIKIELNLRKNKLDIAIKEADRALNNECYTLYFESFYKHWEYPHYVALLSVDKSKFQRDFLQLLKFTDKEGCIVKGECNIPLNAVYEVRDKNGRNAYLIQNNEPIKIGSTEDAKIKANLFSFLKNDIDSNQLLELLNIKKTEVNIPEELKD